MSEKKFLRIEEREGQKGAVYLVEEFKPITDDQINAQYELLREEYQEREDRMNEDFDNQCVTAKRLKELEPFVSVETVAVSQDYLDSDLEEEVEEPDSEPEQDKEEE